MAKSNFYVYVYLDPRKRGLYYYNEYYFKYEPFYVGKGRGKRAHQIHKKLYACGSKIKSLAKLDLLPIIHFVEYDIPEKNALEIEIELIRLIGRKDLNLGPLMNLTDGGEGTSGKKYTDEQRERLSKSHLGKRQSEETKKKISIFFKDRPKPAEVKLNMAIAAKKRGNNKTGIPLSEEHKRKIGNANRGRKHTQEALQKMSKIHKGFKHSDTTKKKMSEIHKGKITYMKGKHHTEDTKRKLSEKLKGRIKIKWDEEHKIAHSKRVVLWWEKRRENGLNTWDAYRNNIKKGRLLCELV